MILLDWLFTVPFLIAFGGALGVFDPLQRIARLFGQRPQEIVVGMLQTTLVQAFRICGTRLEVERSPRVRPRTPYLLVANHQSLFDIPIFGALLFSNFPKYVAKKELGRWIPSISYNLRRGGNAVIDRKDRQQALDEIRKLGKSLSERRVSAVIYPEGTRSRHGELGAFRPAGTLELLEAAPDVAIVPVAIDGAWKLLRNNLFPVPFGTTVRVRFGDPIPRRPDEDRMAILEHVRGEIATTLDGWRKAEDQYAPKVK
ncbi:1-acyl-sn-glycerol-3-phosphate acyltransferase [Myxococcaceae bacterium]|nr:1-acyl-sn-glycerol-3-phosphate acyltransferase [Myxococcaceae bacterium]